MVSNERALFWKRRQRYKINRSSTCHANTAGHPIMIALWACQMEMNVEKQLVELGCSCNLTADEIVQAGRRAAKSERVCRADVAQVQSMLQ